MRIPHVLRAVGGGFIALTAISARGRAQGVPTLQGLAHDAGRMSAVAFTEIGNTGLAGHGVRVRALVRADIRTNEVTRVIEVVIPGDTSVSVQLRPEEVPSLLTAIDSIVAIRANPTTLHDFTLEYETKSGLIVQVHNDSTTNFKSDYAVLGRDSVETLTRVGQLKDPNAALTTRVVVARRGMSEYEMWIFKRLLVSALTVLNSAGAHVAVPAGQPGHDPVHP